MAITERIKSQAIQLSYSDSGNVTVTPENEDRFVLTAQNAVRACQEHHLNNEAIKRFKTGFLRPLHEWCLKHASSITACFIAAPTDHLQVFVIGATPKYDFALGKEVSALERQLYDAGWKLSVLQIPDSDEEELQTYFDIEGALQVYAQLQPTPGQGGSQ